MSGHPSTGMVDVFVERHGLPLASVYDEPAAAASCCELHRARWQASYVAESGPRICHYRAPDAESVRRAFRTAGVRVDSIWAGTVHGDHRVATEYILVDLELSPPLPADSAGALEQARSAWLRPAGLRLAQAFVSAGRGRVICLCEVPETSVALVDRSVPGPDRLWRCRSITADTQLR